MKLIKSLHDSTSVQWKG